VRYRRFLLDYPGYEVSNIWLDIAVRTDKQYVVETSTSAIQRCILMTSDPGDLVLDPTCGSGTTAFVAEQWGVVGSLSTHPRGARTGTARVMGARFAFYLLADSRDGQIKQGQIQQRVPSEEPTHGNVRQGFVYERVPHITLRSIANNSEIDVIWQEYQQKLEPLRERLNLAVKKRWTSGDSP